MAVQSAESSKRHASTAHLVLTEVLPNKETVSKEEWNRHAKLYNVAVVHDRLFEMAAKVEVENARFRRLEVVQSEASVKAKVQEKNVQ